MSKRSVRTRTPESATARPPYNHHRTDLAHGPGAYPLFEGLVEKPCRELDGRSSGHVRSGRPDRHHGHGPPAASLVGAVAVAVVCVDDLPQALEALIRRLDDPGRAFGAPARSGSLHLDSLGGCTTTTAAGRRRRWTRRRGNRRRRVRRPSHWFEPSRTGAPSCEVAARVRRACGDQGAHRFARRELLVNAEELAW